MRNFKIIFLIVLLIALGIFPFVMERNEESNYEINNAIFEINLESNGDAIVKEKWCINNLSKKDNFSKEITSNKVEILNCKVNNNECKIKGEEYSYLLDKKDDISIINLKHKPENGIINYEIEYRIKDIVKRLNDKNVIFSYYVTGKDITKTIKEFEITINTPENASVKIDEGNFDEVKMSNKSTYLKRNNVSGMQKYKLTMSSNIFDEMK